MNYRLRPATAGDAPILTAFRVKLFQEIGHVDESSPAAAFESACLETVTEYLESGRAFAWIAESERSEPVGTIILLLHARLPSPRIPVPTEGYILNVFVEKDWRKRGVGAALMRATLDHARSLGLARLRLHTTPAGRSTYARSGFKPREDEMEMILSPAGISQA